MKIFLLLIAGCLLTTSGYLSATEANAAAAQATDEIAWRGGGGHNWHNRPHTRYYRHPNYNRGYNTRYYYRANPYYYNNYYYRPYAYPGAGFSLGDGSVQFYWGR